MSAQPLADALVLFGATGDLCYRKIFPALYQLERRGRLAVPVIGVARAGWAAVSGRAAAGGGGVAAAALVVPAGAAVSGGRVIGVAGAGSVVVWPLRDLSH